MLNDIFWTANPILLDSTVSVRWYGLMFAIGFLAGYEILSRIFKREGTPEKWMGLLFIYVVIATIVGARLGHVFFYEWDAYKHRLLDIFKIWEGGLASHGGTLGLIIAVWIYSCCVTKRSMLWTMDRLCVPIGLVAALIRFGNLFNHEIYGAPTDLPWGFHFIDNIVAYMHGAEPVFTPACHPTQLYEALCYLIVFALCMWLYWRRNAQERPGLLIGIFMIGVFASRFVIEFLKNEQVGWENDMRAAIGLDQGQMLSIPFIIFGVWMVVRALRRPRVAIEYPNRWSDSKENKKN